MIKTTTDLQTLDVEVGIMVEIYGNFDTNSALLSALKKSFNKNYTDKDLQNLRRYHDFINCRREFEELAEFTFV